MSNLAHSTTNDTRLDEFEAFVREKGREQAAGNDALPSLAIGFARAVYDGVVDIAKDPNGDDAAQRYFKKYSQAQGKKAFHDRSENSQKAQVSKLRQIQLAASNPKFDFVDVLNRAVTIRQQAIKDSVDVKSPFPAYVDVAREQNKLDDEMSDDMIFAAVTKNDTTKEKTVVGELKRAQKIIDDIIAGEKYPGVQDQSPEVMIAGEQLKARIGELELKTRTDKARAEAIALGLLSDDENTIAA